MKVLVLGAGISGHTAALLLRRKLGREHEVTVVSPKPVWNWIPSNIWVGVGQMRKEEVIFELAPVYKKAGIRFFQARATEIHPEGDHSHDQAYVTAASTESGNLGEKIELEYDFLINATGPHLNFAATPGLGPGANSYSVCTHEEAHETSLAIDKLVAEMKAGKRKTFVVGAGHGLCTCEGAAFEYTLNLEFELRRRGVRDKAWILYLTNEAELGDFGVGGMLFHQRGYITPSRIFAESLFVERNIDWIVGAHVHKVDAGSLEYEGMDGVRETLAFDFAMLLPPFRGVPLKAFDKEGQDISSRLFAPSGFMKVDADYTQKPYEQWMPEDWPSTYQSSYKNIFAIGIAFAPPHQISRPRTSAGGTPITPAPPRTGMPSAIMGRIVANSIADMIKTQSKQPSHAASLAEIGAACVASAGAHMMRGSAASMTMYPVIPDYKKYPGSGRSLTHTTGEIGLAGHWIKRLLHYGFLYKAKAKPLWWMIPE